MIKLIFNALIALLPTVILCVYVYRKDRVDKEPLSLLLILFLAGAVAFVPSYFIDNALIKALNALFSGGISYSNEGVIIYADTFTKLAYGALRTLASGCLVDFALKWVLLVLITKNNKNFNCLFDGIVYAVSLFFSFAVAESFTFSYGEGIDRFLSYALNLIPSHVYIGLITGIFYTLWHAYKAAEKKESRLISDGTVNEKRICKSSFMLLLSFIVPLSVNALHSILTFISLSFAAFVIFATVIIVCYAFFFVLVSRFSKLDDFEVNIADKIIGKAHPELKEEVQ